MGFTGIFHGIHQHFLETHRFQWYMSVVTNVNQPLLEELAAFSPVGWWCCQTQWNTKGLFVENTASQFLLGCCGFVYLWPFWKKMLFAECWHAMSRISFVISICWLLKYAFVVSGSWFSHSRIETQVWFLHAPFCWHRTSGSKFPDFVDAFLATLSQRCGHGFGSPILMVSAPPLLYAYRRKSMENS